MVGNIVCAMAKYFNFQGNDSYQKTFLKVVSEFYNFHSPYLPIQNSEGKSWRYLGLLGLSDDILSKLTTHTFKMVESESIFAQYCYHTEVELC